MRVRMHVHTHTHALGVAIMQAEKQTKGGRAEGTLEKGKTLWRSGRLIGTHSSLSISSNVVGVLIKPPFKKATGIFL